MVEREEKREREEDRQNERRGVRLAGLVFLFIWLVCGVALAWCGAANYPMWGLAFPWLFVVYFFAYMIATLILVLIVIAWAGAGLP